MHAYFGHVDQVFRTFSGELYPGWSGDKSFYAENPYLAFELFLPEMRSVRADPRFMPFAAKIGLVDYWLDTDQWPDYCKNDKEPYTWEGLLPAPVLAVTALYDCKEAALAARANAAAKARADPVGGS